MKLQFDSDLHICNNHIFANSISWCPNGKFHKEDGPAIVHSDGSQEWYKNGARYREDGPAIMHANGYQSWWVDGQRIKWQYS